MSTSTPKVTFPVHSKLVSFQFKLPDTDWFMDNPQYLKDVLGKDDANLENLPEVKERMMREDSLKIMFYVDHPTNIQEFVASNYDMYVFLHTDKDFNDRKLLEMIKVAQSPLVNGGIEKYGYQFKSYHVGNCCSGIDVMVEGDEESTVDYNYGEFDIDKAINSLTETLLSHLYQNKVLELVHMKEEYDKFQQKDLYTKNPMAAAIVLANNEIDVSKM